jgi:diguanylate cyclase (GGDEF)-like protein
LISAIRPALLASCAHLLIESSAPAALARMQDVFAPSLALLDIDLPGMNIGQLVAAVRAGCHDRTFPIVLISDNVAPEWIDRLAEGVIDDLIPQNIPPEHLRLRLQNVLRTFRHGSEFEHLRETAALQGETDRLTGLHNRPALLSMLFRETDRVQRMNTSLCLLLFGIDDFERWPACLGAAACDDLLTQVVARVLRLLRTYDLFGRVGQLEFLLGLPGCSPVNAVSLAERIRVEVFSATFRVGRDAVRLTASFGIAPSQGRSPVVVLREAERALEEAKASGPESIQCSSNVLRSLDAPGAFLSSAAAFITR